MKLTKQHLAQTSTVANMVGAALFLGIQVYDLWQGHRHVAPFSRND